MKCNENTPQKRLHAFNYFETQANQLWPHQHPSKQQIIDAGLRFYPLNHIDNDTVQCMACEVELGRWNTSDDPYEEHLKASPHCMWLKKDREARLKAEEEAKEKARLEAFACKRCSAKFASNIKLHMHIQEHHAKKQSEAPKEAFTSTSPPPSAPLAPKLSLSVIRSIETSSSSPPTKLAPTSKPTSSSKSALPLIPPATPSKTWAAVASKSAFKPASAATTLQSHQKRIQTSSKPYFIVADLYRMFHVKESPHQTRITSFFKPVRNSLGNRLSTTKKAPFSLSSSTPPNSHLNNDYCMRPLEIGAPERYVSDLPLKMAPGKHFENTTHTAPPTNGTTAPTRPNYYGVHIKTSAPRRCHLKDP